MKEQQKTRHQERGITGLETAIILIAFVVVAAVFAYVVLSAGLFSTQKSQEAIHTGLNEAQGALEMRGNLIAKAESAGTNGQISQLVFTVACALNGGEPVNFTPPSAASANTGMAASSSNNVVVISYMDQDQAVHNLYWTINKLGCSDSDDLLENDEMFEITVGAPVNGQDGGNLVDALATPLSISKSFVIEVKPPSGAILKYERTTPAYIDMVMNLN